MNWSEHPAAAIFPLLEGADLDELVADIKANGLRDPIVTWRDTILDGRNRLRACERAGVAPHYREWSGDDPVAFVISANLHRRHLNSTQKAAIAARLAIMRQGQRTDLVAQNLTSAPGQKLAMETAARQIGVSPQSVARAKTVLDHGSSAQVTAMERGTLPLRPTAEKLRSKIAGDARKGKRRDPTATYQPVTQGQHDRARGQKERLVLSLSTIQGHCRGLAELDVGMAVAALARDELASWAKLARENARVLTTLATQLERTHGHGTKAA